MTQFFKFIIAMVISFIPGIFGVMFTPHGASDTWYNALAKSTLTPDGMVFMVAWLILYALLGVALFLVMNNKRPNAPRGRAYALFALQMILNAMWSYVFFGLHLVGMGLFVLGALIIASVWMARVFWEINRGASLLTWVYIAWSCFAMYLNSMIYYLN